MWVTVGSTALVTGLNVVGAPLPRERFVGFTCMSACMGLVGGATPAALLFAICALIFRARQPSQTVATGGVWGRG
jgi:hypothetical protein